jgi:hypothetical protein
VDDVQETDWQTWSGQVQIEYNVSGVGLGLGTHNVSLIYNDRYGQCYHDDVTVTVTESVVVSWDVLNDLDFEIDLGRRRDCDLVLNFKNTGNATLLGLNFSITTLPEAWTADVYTQLVTQLAPNETVQVSFTITVPNDEGKFLEWIGIDFSATVLENGENVSDTIAILITGVTYSNFTIWLIIIVGSVAAVGVSSFMVYRRRQRPVTKPKKKLHEGFKSLKKKLLTRFPESYSIITPGVMEKLKSIQGVSEEELPSIIEYLNQLDEDEALAWLDEMQRLTKE